MNTNSDRYHINSILRACSIMRHLAKLSQPCRISRLAKDLQLDRSTVYRILLTLEQCSFVKRDSKTGEYSLGIGDF